MRKPTNIYITMYRLFPNEQGDETAVPQGLRSRNDIALDERVDARPTKPQGDLKGSRKVYCHLGCFTIRVQYTGLVRRRGRALIRKVCTLSKELFVNDMVDCS